MEMAMARWRWRKIAAPQLMLYLCALLLSPALCDLNSERVAELLQLQAGSPDKVIDLDDSSIQRFASDDLPRPYSLFIFFDYLQLRANSELPLEELRREFGAVASAYVKNNAGKDGASKVFFGQLEFKKAQASFALFGVNSLPHVRLLTPASSGPKEAETMGTSEIVRGAEGMGGFLESRTKQTVGPIVRSSSWISKTQLQILGAGLVIAAPFVLKKIVVISAPVYNPNLWCIGALTVYFFSVSGGMHNIIRKMPLFLMDRQKPGKYKFFHQGSGMQLGTEGFVVGFLYTIVGLLIAFMTHSVTKVTSKMVQRLLMLLAMGISFYAVKTVIFLDNWKTGYAIHAYLPKKWT